MQLNADTLLKYARELTWAELEKEATVVVRGGRAVSNFANDAVNAIRNTIRGGGTAAEAKAVARGALANKNITNNPISRSNMGVRTQREFDAAKAVPEFNKQLGTNVGGGRSGMYDSPVWKQRPTQGQAALSASKLPVTAGPVRSNPVAHPDMNAHFEQVLQRRGSPNAGGVHTQPPGTNPVHAPGQAPPSAPRQLPAPAGASSSTGGLGAMHAADTAWAKNLADSIPNGPSHLTSAAVGAAGGAAAGYVLGRSNNQQKSAAEVLYEARLVELEKEAGLKDAWRAVQYGHTQGEAAGKTVREAWRAFRTPGAAKPVSAAAPPATAAAPAPATPWHQKTLGSTGVTQGHVAGVGAGTLALGAAGYGAHRAMSPAQNPNDQYQPIQ